LPQLNEAEPERVFEGHAAFSADGRVLFTSETDVITGQGLVGVRDSRSLAKLDEFPTHGIGPHMLLVEQSGALLIANGGILTLPETGRTKLNLDRMDASLVRLSSHTGWLLGQWRLPDPRLSIRHLARARDSSIGIALQAQHDDLDQRRSAPIFAYFNGDQIRIGEMPTNLSLGGYAGDITCVPEPGVAHFAVSCSGAGVVGCWDDSLRWCGRVPIQGVCGLTHSQGDIIATSEAGEIVRFAPATLDAAQRIQTSVLWDNHLAVRASSLT
jgi:hypothetical protein